MSKYADSDSFSSLGSRVNQGGTSTYTPPGISTTKTVMGTVMSVIHDGTNRSLGDIIVNVSQNNMQIEKIVAQPIGRHTYTCPLPNEKVYCVQDQSSGEWFYTGIASNEHNINHMLNGSVPTYKVETNSYYTGKHFKAHPDSARAVDVFEGDTIVQSRNGSSIRMSHTNPGFANPWNNGARGETTPILTLRTGHLPIENLRYDYSSIWLTSDQSVSIPLPTELPSEIPNTGYKHAQLIGISDRIILGSRSDDIILSSGGTIQLLTREWHHDVDVVLDNVKELIAIVTSLLSEVKTIADTSTKQTFVVPGVGTTATTTQLPRFVQVVGKCAQIEQQIQQVDQNLGALQQK